MIKNMLIILIFGILLISGASAKFVCGEVEESVDNVSASWYRVNYYYSSHPDEYKTCEVSPEEGKYCCNLEEIRVKNWQEGDRVGAQIIDINSGYVALPVEMTLSKSAYDIFPKMKLEKVITLNSHFEKFSLTSKKNISFNFSFLFPYTNVDLELNSERANICSNCSGYNFSIEGGYGTNNLIIYASDSNTEFREDFSFSIIPGVNFSREFECEGCKKSKLRLGEKINVTLNIDFGYEVSQIKLREFVPTVFEVVNSSFGEVIPFKEEHNIIEWEVSGRNFSYTYQIKAPLEKEKGLHFYSYVEEEEINKEKIKFHKYIPSIIDLGGGFKLGPSGGGSYSGKLFSKVKNNRALIANNESLLMALYSKDSFEKGFLELLDSDFEDRLHNISLDFLKGYNVNSNIPLEEFFNSSFEIDLNRSSLEDYNGVEVYGVSNKGKIKRLTGFAISPGQGNIEYSFSSPEFLKNVLVYGVKKKLSAWDYVVAFFWKAEDIGLFNTRFSVVDMYLEYFLNKK